MRRSGPCRWGLQQEGCSNGSINCKALHTAAGEAAGEAAAASVRMEVRVNASLWTDVIA